MKRCELCKAKARMQCAADQASLCWACDAAVHSANFLVARHSRKLLCEVCQSPTPWSASGCKLRPTVSVCEQCVEVYDGSESDAVEENQVVPLSSSDESVSRKRFRNESQSQTDQSCTTSPVNIRRPSRTRSVQIMDSGRVDVCGSGILDSLRRLHEEDMGSVQQIFEFCTSPPPSL